MRRAAPRVSLPISLVSLIIAISVAPISHAATEQERSRQAAEIARQLLCASQNSLKECLDVNQILTNPGYDDGQWHGDNGQWDQNGSWGNSPWENSPSQNNGQWEDNDGTNNQNGQWQQNQDGYPRAIRISRLQRHYPLRNQQALIQFEVAAASTYLVNAELYNRDGNRVASAQAQATRQRTPMTLAVNNPGTYRLQIQANNGLGAQNYTVSVTGRNGINPDEQSSTQPADYPEYQTGTPYQAGDVVRRNGRLYQCRPWPNSGWCGQGELHYAPGTGMNWQDAWQYFRG